jgi:hypothetical protein
MLSQALVSLYHECISSDDYETRSLGIGYVFETKRQDLQMSQLKAGLAVF